MDAKIVFPSSAATRLKSNAPTGPQLSVPTITSPVATMSNGFMTDSFATRDRFGRRFTKNRHLHQIFQICQSVGVGVVRGQADFKEFSERSWNGGEKIAKICQWLTPRHCSP